MTNVKSMSNDKLQICYAYAENYFVIGNLSFVILIYFFSPTPPS